MRLIVGLLLIAFLSGCKEEVVPLPYYPRSEHDAYLKSLENANLLSTALGKDWETAAAEALNNPVRINTPFMEAFYLDPKKAESVGYRFTAKRGHKVLVDIDFQISEDDTTRVFADLYRVEDDSLGIWRHVATADKDELMISFGSRKDADYILRLQPELLRGGNFKVTIRKVPSLRFPVAGKDSKSVGSFFGDPRDGGRREHHGVDIFARRHTPIIAPSKGYVRFVGTRGMGGKVIWIRDQETGDNLYFAHLQDQLVERNTRVEPGDTIGTVGNTGNARYTPPHLHFGIYNRGPLDPWNFIAELNERPDSIEADTGVLGKWIEATKVTFLTQSADEEGSVVDTVGINEVMKAYGTSSDLYRVVLPDGTSGYIASGSVKPAFEEVQITAGPALKASTSESDR